MHRQYVSGKLAAQSLSGNIKGQFQCLEANANNNLTITLVVKVISADGSTTRATLLAITRDGTEANTSLRNLIFASAALSSYTCVDGDRLLIEVGLAGSSGPAAGGVQGHNGSIRWGCSASSGDLAENDTETGTTFRPWVEISNTWTFLDTPVDAAAGSLSISGASATMVVGRKMTASAGSLSLSGQSATVSYGHFALASPGSYSEVGADATMVKSFRAFTLSVDAGSYSASGSVASVTKGTMFNAAPASYSFAGNNASVLLGHAVNAQAGVYSESGAIIGAVSERAMNAAAGAYSASGQNALVAWGRLLVAASATMTVSGYSASVEYSGGSPVLIDMKTLLGVG